MTGKGPAGVQRPFVSCPLQVELTLSREVPGLDGVAAEAEANIRDQFLSGFDDVDVVAGEKISPASDGPRTLIIKTRRSSIKSGQVDIMVEQVNKALEKLHKQESQVRDVSLVEVKEWKVETRDEIRRPVDEKFRQG